MPSDLNRLLADLRFVLVGAAFGLLVGAVFFGMVCL